MKEIDYKGSSPIFLIFSGVFIAILSVTILGYAGFIVWSLLFS